MNRLRPTPSSNSSGASLSVPTDSIMGRKKVTLAPGHSLMDWIRLGRSAGDLSGVGSKKREVSRAELAQHNTQKDMWMALRGGVYNLTPYLEYHPGGVDELMRAAGADGTDLFDDVHNWVNLESMLKKCYIGALSNSSTCVKPTKRTSLADANTFANLATRSEVDLSIQPSNEMFQTGQKVTIVIYVKSIPVTSNSVIVQLMDGFVLMETRLKDCSYLLRMAQNSHLEKECIVNVTDKKVEISFEKKSNASANLQLVLEESFSKTKYLDIPLATWVVVSNQPVNHDTSLVCLLQPKGLRMVAPIGYHYHIHHEVHGVDLARSYTVALPSLLKEKQDPLAALGKHVYIMVKGYPNGAVSPWVTSLKPGDKVKMDRYDGIFDEKRLHNCTSLVMFAAGTGFTSMIRVIYHCLYEMTGKTFPIKLVFYNKTQADILWRNELTELQKRHKDRFSTTHVLSQETSSSCEELKGRVCEEHIKNFVPLPAASPKVLLCICGPAAYNKAVGELARAHGLTDEHIHEFSFIT